MFSWFVFSELADRIVSYRQVWQSMWVHHIFTLPSCALETVFDLASEVMISCWYFSGRLVISCLVHHGVFDRVRNRSGSNFWFAVGSFPQLAHISKSRPKSSIPIGRDRGRTVCTLTWRQFHPAFAYSQHTYYWPEQNKLNLHWHFLIGINHGCSSKQIITDVILVLPSYDLVQWRFLFNNKATVTLFCKQDSVHLDRDGVSKMTHHSIPV